MAGADEAGDATGGALDWLGSAAEEVGTNVLGAVIGILEAVSTLAVVLLLSALLTFYLLRDGRQGMGSRITGRSTRGSGISSKRR